MKRWLVVLALVWTLLRAAWTLPSTRTTGTLITASIYNVDIIANLLALKNPANAYSNVNSGADFTTTSVSFVNISTTYLEQSITTDGGDIQFFFNGVCNANTQRISFEIFQVGGSRLIGGDGHGVTFSGTSFDCPVSFTHRLSLAAGVYTFRVQWKVSGGVTATLYNGTTVGKDWRPHFRVEQIH